MALNEQEKNINKIKNRTKKNMLALEIYQKEFDSIISVYSQLKHQYETIYKEWAEGGYIFVEEYTNKNGSTNERKTAIYLALESLRKDILVYENALGLTPVGLKKLKQKLDNNINNGGFWEEIKRNE